MSILGDRLRQLREERGLLQRELAESLDLSRVTITQYEQGRRVPEVDILTKIADFYMVSIDYLVGRTDTRTLYTSKQPLDTTQYKKQHADTLPKEAQQCLRDFEEFICQKYGDPTSKK